MEVKKKEWVTNQAVVNWDMCTKIKIKILYLQYVYSVFIIDFKFQDVIIF